MKLDNVKSLLPHWEDWQQKLNGILDNCESEREFAEACMLQEEHHNKLRVAYWLDTRHINSRRKCMSLEVEWIIEQSGKNTGGR